MCGKSSVRGERQGQKGVGGCSTPSPWKGSAGSNSGVPGVSDNQHSQKARERRPGGGNKPVQF